MNNTRFATIIHILTLLAKFPDQWLSSDWIAESINKIGIWSHPNPIEPWRWRKDKSLRK